MHLYRQMDNQHHASAILFYFYGTSVEGQSFRFLANRSGELFFLHCWQNLARICS